MQSLESKAQCAMRVWLQIIRGGYCPCMTIIREGGVFTEERNEAFGKRITCCSNGVGHVWWKHQDGIGRRILRTVR